MELQQRKAQPANEDWWLELACSAFIFKTHSRNTDSSQFLLPCKPSRRTWHVPTHSGLGIGVIIHPKSRMAAELIPWVPTPTNNLPSPDASAPLSPGLWWPCGTAEGAPGLAGDRFCHLPTKPKPQGKKNAERFEFLFQKVFLYSPAPPQCPCTSSPSCLFFSKLQFPALSPWKEGFAKAFGRFHLLYGFPGTKPQGKQDSYNSYIIKRSAAFLLR